MKLRDLIKQIYLSSGKFYSNATADEDLKHFILKNRPRSVGKELIRIGGRGDGGYLIPNDLDGISACFSPGVAASSTFEEELADKYGIKSFMADYSVDHPPISHDLFHFEKKFLGNVNDDKFMRLEDWVNKNVSENDSSDLLLQMDIEGAEYQILVDTPRNTLNKFRIISVEFHLLDTIFNKSAFIMMDAIFDKLNQNYTIAHIHPNNSRPILKKGSVEIPELLEITFLRNDRVLNDGKQLTFPHPLDDQCVEKRPPRHLPKCWWI